MVKLDQPLHDIEQALLATSNAWTHEQLLQYKPLKIALDKAKYYLQRAIYGENIDLAELREYPSAAAVRLSHPIILMENHKISNALNNLTYEHGNQLYLERMELVKGLNKTRKQQGDQALAVMWLPDMVNPLEIFTLSKDDSKIAVKVKEEDRELEVPRPLSPEPKLDMRLAKNRPLKKRPTSSGRMTGARSKKAARMKATA